MKNGIVKEIVKALFNRSEAKRFRHIFMALDPEHQKLFNAEYYVENNPDIARAGFDPFEHYLVHGWKEGRNPSSEFDTAHYLKSYPDVAAGKVNPLIHYVQFGHKEGRKIVPASVSDHQIEVVVREHFDVDFYLRTYPDVGAAGEGPLTHFLNRGWQEYRDPSPEFSTSFYVSTYEDARDFGQNPFYHYLKHGKKRGYLARPGNQKPRAKVEPEKNVPSQVTPVALPLESEARPSVDLSDVDKMDQRLGYLAELIGSGLLNEAWYVSQNPDLATVESPAIHYLLNGEAEGRRPNPYFDPKWYSQKYFESEPAIGYLAYYYVRGERAGHKPCPSFDVKWYSATYEVSPARESVLQHYLHRLTDGQHAPNAYFSPAFYYKHNPDIAKAKIDPYEHFLRYGQWELRRGSENFDQQYVWRQYLNNDTSLNPIEQFMEFGEQLKWSPVRDVSKPTLHDEIRKFCAPGPQFEVFEPVVDERGPKAKCVAFYLPQFHPIAENDEWWGKGFTEWRNVSRGVPRFENHYQPRIPRDLGFYDLNDTEIMKKQVELARSAGLHGFCFYYYNFNGHRLLDKPLDAFVESPDIDFPFSILWANENWTRRWDGLESDVLIRQDYRKEDAPALIDDLARYLKHPNYIKAGDRPIFYLYRPGIIPNCRETLTLWRKLFLQRHNIKPLIVAVQGFGLDDLMPLGFDGALEFPPHKLCANLPPVKGLEIFDQDFQGLVVNYDDLVEASLLDVKTSFPLIKTASPMWDNDARKQGSSGELVVQGSTPQKFETWIRALVKNSRRNLFHGESFVFVNAWNEWCEGTYLEPDCHFGHAYLNSLSRALHTVKPVSRAKLTKLILVGHDAYTHGAQILLLNIGKTLKSKYGVEVSFILANGGTLLNDYKAVGATFVIPSGADGGVKLKDHALKLKAAGFSRVITNTTVVGNTVQVFKHLGMEVASLLHELPSLIRNDGLERNYEEIRDYSDYVVFPNNYVKTELEENFGTPVNKAVIRPQGLYHLTEPAPNCREKIRRQLGLAPTDKIVINVAYGDQRKGVDLFMIIADAVGKQHENIHFVWVGAQHTHFFAWIQKEIERRGVKNLHFVPFTKDFISYIGAADLFFLTSREDPFPSVVLDSLACGVPVLAFDWGGGYVDLLQDRKLGSLTQYLDTYAASQNIPKLLNDRSQYLEKTIAYRKNYVREKYDFVEYCSDLAALMSSNLKSVSVVVPNYNYAGYIAERLDSIQTQTYPIAECIVLDDKSTDNSVEVIETYRTEEDFSFELIKNAVNSGGGYQQWDKGAHLAKGDLVWIAEADDLARPEFLAESVTLLQDPDVAFVFCDSNQIDENDKLISESYIDYCNLLEDGAFNQSFIMDGPEFVARYLAVKNVVMNVSGVVWRRSVLLDVLAQTRELHTSMRVACDWRMYILAAMKHGKVGYLANTLNTHRRHSKSVTHSRNGQAHYNEIVDTQEFARASVKIDVATAKKVASYRKEVAGYLGVSAYVEPKAQAKTASKAAVKTPKVKQVPTKSSTTTKPPVVKK